MTGGVQCVLFTDLVGSTEMMTRLGDAAFDRVRSEHFAGLREAIADTGGVEVKNTGDLGLALAAATQHGLANVERRAGALMEAAL